ncbi:beta-ketoacyl-[acyl-carrier-protein] synthase family protein [Desulfocurvibacter africanus]|uniref:beta-ketoacyl-[acyl-carrier-protein] synthase family protein n=1 Tax=Desulfocurvibacter africanus TaxID=873 RepID=UPI0004109195|nr:beta-ketoacyl-[acyl-carrier-protein] synthase family protein [Desulfocurvibacter africanus]
MSIRGRGVAVAGLGCLCAAGLSVDECVRALFRGERDPRPPARLSTNLPTRNPVFELPESFIAVEPLARREDTTLTAAMAVATAREALTMAGLTPAALSGLRVGALVGTTVGSAMNNEEFYREYRTGGRPSMKPITRFLHSNPASVLAREFDLRGPVQTVVNACSSGTDAVGLAAEWIAAGLCDAVLAGGSDELCRVTYLGFNSLMIFDSEPCKPFDANRKGLNLGEGAAMLLLLSDAAAVKLGCKPRFRVLGYGSACDAYHPTAPKPDGAGLRAALSDALRTSNLAPSDIAFVNAHGTGTPDNDRVESLVLPEALPGVPYLSTKGMTGHTLGAAGAIEAVFTAACLELGKIPASLGLTQVDPSFPSSPVTERTQIKGKAGLSQSLAFGGNNSAVVIALEDT